MRWSSAVGVILMLAGSLHAQRAAPRPLDIRFLDVEGGQATLLVAPSGESMLIDTGFPGNGGRDLNRILAAIKDAGLKKLDYLVITHYHSDHVGNAAAIAAKIPVGTFVDHGPLRERTNELDALYEGYVKARAGGRHIEAKPGDRIPIRDLDATIVASDGALLASPLPGAGEPNPLCENSRFRPKKPWRAMPNWLPRLTRR